MNQTATETWRIDDEHIGFSGALRIVGEHGWLIAEADDPQDAAYIAAMPQLLEACEALVAEVNGFCPICSVDDGHTEDCPVAMAISAIAKAKEEDF